MRFRLITAFTVLFLALGTAFAAADDNMSGSTMTADGTMTMSPGMASLMHQTMSSTSCQGAMSMRQPGVRCFKVQIDNISTTDEFSASNGVKWTLPFSPGVFVVTANGSPFFTNGSPDRGEGLRSQAEDGDPVTLAQYAGRTYPTSGAFLVPVGGSKPRAILPGQSFEFFVAARAGESLFFTTMFGQSNDWFYSPPAGIALFSTAGSPIAGDVTAQVRLYDAGTEADEELGIGPHQAPRQPHPRYGDADPNPLVRLATSDPRFIDVAKVMHVTVTPQ
jgi:hypothetical protein